MPVISDRDVGISEGDVVGKFVGIIDALIEDSLGHVVGELLGNSAGGVDGH